MNFMAQAIGASSNLNEKLLYFGRYEINLKKSFFFFLDISQLLVCLVIGSKKGIKSFIN